MADHLRKVNPGDPLVIPASTYNTFVDLARDYLAGRQRPGPSGPMGVPAGPGVVLLRDESGIDHQRFEVLAVNVSVYNPSTDLEAFQNHPLLTANIPNAFTPRGKFAVLLEPSTSGSRLVHAVVTGMVPVKIDAPASNPYRYADIVDGVATHLRACGTGAAEILWRASGAGVQWGLVRLGTAPARAPFPVNLALAGGTGGSNSSPATWTYHVVDPFSGATLASNVSPVAPPHKWQRPSAGYMYAANFGYAHWDASDQLVLGWINETVQPYYPP